MSHTRPADLVARRLEGTPLPCDCPDCSARVRAWESDRAAAAGTADALPPSFWTAQEARLEARAAAEAVPVRPRALAVAAAAALLVLGTGLGLVLTRHAAPAADDYETRYAAVQEAMERSAIGDLEACGVLINDSDEGGDAAEEAL